MLAKSEYGISKQEQASFEDNVKRLLDTFDNKENITDKDISKWGYTGGYFYKSIKDGFKSLRGFKYVRN